MTILPKDISSRRFADRLGENLTMFALVLFKTN
jgi:hypothetical protein